jgi:hypothetical protein
MRLSSLFVAAAVVVTTPAFGQENAAANQANVTTSNEVAVNTGISTETTTTAAPPATQAAPAPEATQTSTNTSTVVQKERTFPWGVLGVLGLLGLLGRRRSAG